MQIIIKMKQQQEQASDRMLTSEKQIDLKLAETSQGFRSYNQLKKNKTLLFRKHIKLQAPYRQLGWTNAVLVYLQKNKIMMMQNSSTDIYLPGYLRVKIKNFLKISIEDTESSTNALIVFSIYYGSLPSEIVEAFKQKVVLQFSRDDPLRLIESNDNSLIQIQEDQELKLINYKIRAKINLVFITGRQMKVCWGKVDTSIWFSPFQLIYQKLLITVNKIRLSKNNMIGDNDKEKDQKWNKIRQFFGTPQLKSLKIMINLMDFYIEDKYKNILKDDQYSKDTLFRIQAFKQLSQIEKLKLYYKKEPMFGNYVVADKRFKAIYSQTKQITIKQIYEENLQNGDHKKNLFKNKAKEINQFNKQICLYLLRRSSIQQGNKQMQRQSRVDHQQSESLIQLIVQNQIKQVKYTSKYHFQYGHFIVPLYKIPYVSIVTIFIPLFFLALVNLTIFQQDSDFSNRVANIATLLISYVAYFPVIRQQIPQYNKILLVQILVYLQVIANFCCLLQSILVIGQNNNFSQWGTLFIISASLNVIIFLIIVVMMILYQFIWRPSYVCKDNETYNQEFLHILWFNEECDRFFQQIEYIKPLKQYLSLKSQKK